MLLNIGYCFEFVNLYMICKYVGEVNLCRIKLYPRKGMIN